MNRLEALERVAAAARNESNLRRLIAKATDSRLAMDRLTQARAELDEALEDLTRLERE